MSDLPKNERTILELTNIKPRSRKYLQNKLYALIGASQEQVDKTIRELVAKNWLTENNETFKSNPDSNFFLYPPEIDELMSNGKAIHKVITLANKAYYPNLKFEEFMKDHLNRSVDRDYVRRILVTAYGKGFVKGLPIELRTNGFSYKLTKFKNRFSNGVNWIVQHPFIQILVLISTLCSIAGFIYIFHPEWFQTTQQENFNQSEWNVSLEFNEDKRARMVDDLVANYLYYGMHYKQVKSLLGTKEMYRTDPPGGMLYSLYEDYGWDIDPVETKTLRLSFTDSLLTKVEHIHWVKNDEETIRKLKLNKN